MTTPLYLECQPPASPGSGHRGLWYERFFSEYNDNYTALRSKDNSKKDWIEKLGRTAGDKDEIKDAVSRLEKLCEKMQGEYLPCAASWHFATGLGNPHPVENGFLWHPTLGVPYIPGAAVKGLVRAYVEAWMDHDSVGERKEKLHRWFGSEDKEPADCGRGSQAGAFIFFDALPMEPVKLRPDIMTPHMGEWYENGGEIDSIKDQPERIPADWHDPNPIPFLVAEKPQFMFAVAPRDGKESNTELGGVMEALREALAWLGAGAKTAAGYGRMHVTESPVSKAQEWLDSTMQGIRNDKHSKGQPEENLWKKALSVRYVLAPPEIKELVLPMIRAKWEALGIDWNNPQRKSAVEAKRNFSH